MLDDKRFVREDGRDTYEAVREKIASCAGGEELLKYDLDEVCMSCKGFSVDHTSLLLKKDIPLVYYHRGPITESIISPGEPVRVSMARDQEEIDETLNDLEGVFGGKYVEVPQEAVAK